MKPIKKIKKLSSGKTMIEEWDCWKEEEGPNEEVVNKLNLNLLPNYETKYNGKVYVHMTRQNGSSPWFFITYLIYAFGGKIKRLQKKCYGQTIKYGSIEKNKQLVLLGQSGTTSGDGNSIETKYKNINIECPTEQFISCSVLKSDWNRFWIA